MKHRVAIGMITFATICFGVTPFSSEGTAKSALVDVMNYSRSAADINGYFAFVFKSVPYGYVASSYFEGRASAFREIQQGCEDALYTVHIEPPSVSNPPTRMRGK